MDTKVFLQKILPTNGFLLLAKWLPFAEPTNGRDGTTIYKPFGPEQYDEMAFEALKQSNAGENVYFACSSFKEITYKDTYKGDRHPEWWGKAGRLQSNVRACKAFWLDLDVGKADPDKSYDSQRDAAAALQLLCREVGLPLPMLVSSGNGLHCYWVLNKEIPADQWKRVARLLASACDHLKVKHDSSCTTDESRILRPVGTVNPKGGKTVRILRDADPLSAGEFAAPLVSYVKRNSLKVPKAVEAAPRSGMGAALLDAVEYPPSSGYVIADHCATVAHFRDVVGNVSEPLWYVMGGLLKHTTEGGRLFHDWSSGHPDYDEDNTNTKLEQWTYGPPSCDKIKQEAGKLCDGCTKKCKSPIQLGHVISAEAVAAPATVQASAPSAPVIPFCPAGFRWTGVSMVQQVPDKDGVLHDVPFADTLFFITNRVRDEKGEWGVRIRMSVAGHEWREFDMPSTLMADRFGLAKHLAKYEVLVFNPQPAVDYMRGTTQMLMKFAQQTVTIDRFGWDEGRFVVGKTAFLPDGSTEEVLVSENVTNSRRGVDCTPQGDLNTWVSLLDQAYNRPNAEHYQFIICAYGFASPLVPMADFKNFRGIPVVLSGEGGIGKSSVFKAANTIYADPNVLMIDASSKGGATLQGLLGMASTFNGTPLLFDELTERDDKDFTPVMYNLSNGTGKIRMTSNGKFAETVEPFAGIYGGTSNDNVTDKIYSDEKKDISDAASARCFEIGGLTKKVVDKTFAGTNMKELLEHGLFKHHGVAAQVYVPYIAKNRDAVVALLAKTRIKLGSDAAAESRERYYIDLIAFAYVAGSIAKRLGLINWDVKAMTKWALDHLRSLRRSFAERTASTEDNLSLFLRWMHGSIILTKHFPSTKPKHADIETQIEPVRGKPLARIALQDRKMLVAVSALQEWCKEYNQVPEKVRDQLIKDNYILRTTREIIGKGTLVTTGQMRVYEFNYDKIAGALHLVQNVSDGGDTTETATEVTAAVT